MKKIGSLFKSRRFWISLAGLIGVVVAFFTGVDPGAIEKAVLLIAAWVVGDSIRVTA